MRVPWRRLAAGLGLARRRRPRTPEGTRTPQATPRPAQRRSRQELRGRPSRGDGASWRPEQLRAARAPARARLRESRPARGPRLPPESSCGGSRAGGAPVSRRGAQARRPARGPRPGATERTWPARRWPRHGAGYRRAGAAGSAGGSRGAGTVAAGGSGADASMARPRPPVGARLAPLPAGRRPGGGGSGAADPQPARTARRPMAARPSGGSPDARARRPAGTCGPGRMAPQMALRPRSFPRRWLRGRRASRSRCHRRARWAARRPGTPRGPSAGRRPRRRRRRAAAGPGRAASGGGCCRDATRDGPARSACWPTARRASASTSSAWARSTSGRAGASPPVVAASSDAVSPSSCSTSAANRSISYWVAGSSAPGSTAGRHLHRGRRRRAATVGAGPLAVRRPRTRRRRRRPRWPSPSSAPAPAAPWSGRGGRIVDRERRPRRRQRPTPPAGRAGPLARALAGPLAGAGVQQAADQARAGHEHAVGADVADDPVEVAAAQRRGVADDDQHGPGARERDVDPLHQAQEADVAAAVAAHQRDDDDVFLAPLEGVHRVDLEQLEGVAVQGVVPLVRGAVGAVLALVVAVQQEPAQQGGLLGVGRDHADLDLALGAAEDVPGDGGDEARLGDVHQRGAATARLAQAVQATGIDPGDGGREERDVRDAAGRPPAGAQLPLVEHLGDQPGDDRVHPVLLVQEDGGGLREAALAQPGEQALADRRGVARRPAPGAAPPRPRRGPAAAGDGRRPG